MKKLISLCLIAVAAAFVANANEPSNVNVQDSNKNAAEVNPTSVVSTEINAEAISARVNYDGPAYAAGEGMIPKAAGSVSVYWTTEDCSVNGNSGYTPYKISGGTFTMMVNGRAKEMTQYVNYKGDRYYFQL